MPRLGWLRLRVLGRAMTALLSEVSAASKQL